MKLDSRDRKLIAMLERNARTPVAEIARALHLARSTVQERIARLEQSGVIEGYTVALNTELLPRKAIRSRVAVSVQSPRLNAVVRQLADMPEVTCCETVSGQLDLMLEVETDTTEQLDAVVEAIGALPGVERTESNIVLRQFFSRSL